MKMIERTFVAIKPDGVQRGLVGEIIKRLENVGLKIIGMKMMWIDKEFAKKHYTEDIAKRRGEHVREMLLDYITEGPIIVMAWEGIHAIDVVRKLVGPTEPKSALPGTIRGDFTHVSFTHADAQKKSIKNVIHASGDGKDAKYELNLWFSPLELHTYRTVHEAHVM
ncbi:nucleoside-diphosphate kinase [Candidatus Woesearchaeota archaeon]|nr:nucleoside-diphosphate kinase [Candidatus Woesearchaeota archaeon]